MPQQINKMLKFPVLLDWLTGAKRPLLHIGQGVRLAGAIPALHALLEKVRIPVLTARNGNDIIASDHPLYIGRPGTFAQRGANFAVQASDLYIAVGTRLCMAQTGYNHKDYARNATIVHVDIDSPELNKGRLRAPLLIQQDARAFLEQLSAQVAERLQWPEWYARCKSWQHRYPAVTDDMRVPDARVNAYHLAELLSMKAHHDDIVVTDMGLAFQCTHTAWHVREGQRLFTNGGLAPMGWGLPAAIGAHLGTGRRVICISGDGGLMMNLQELASLRHHDANVKLFVLNNGGYVTMRQSQKRGFGRLTGSDAADLTFPHFGMLAHSFDLPYMRLISNGDAKERIHEALEADGPVFVEVMADPEQYQVQSINKRIDGHIVPTRLEDMYPFLPEEQLMREMQI